MTLDYKILGQLYYGPELEFVPSTPGTPGTEEIPPTGYYTTMVPTPVNKFFAFFNNDSYIASSDNGIDWITQDIPITSQWSKPFLFKNKVMFLGRFSSDYLYSSDGETWSVGYYPKNGSFVSAVNNDERIIVLTGSHSNNSLKSLVSEDGTNWTEYDSVPQDYWYYNAYANGVFVFTNGTYNNVITYTADGINWGTEDISNTYSSFNVSAIGGIQILNNKFFIGDYEYEGGIESTNGYSWTLSMSYPPFIARKIFYLNNKTIATSRDNSANIAVKSDGDLSWTTVTLPVEMYNSDIVYGNGKFIMVKTFSEFDPDTVLSSTDALTWQVETADIKRDEFDYIADVRFFELTKLVETQTSIGGQGGTPGTPGTPGYYNELANPQVLYTVPAGTQTTVTAIYTANLDEQEGSYDLAVVPAGETLSLKHHIKWDAVATESDFNLTDIKITLSAGDSIYVFPSTFNKVGFTAFGIEIS